MDTCFSGTAKYRAERQSEIHQTVDLEQIEKRGSQNTIRNFPFAIKSLLKNLTYVLIILAGCASGGAVSGATSFLSKFIQNEFHITAGNAAIYAGKVVCLCLSNVIIGLPIQSRDLTTTTLHRRQKFTRRYI